MLSNKSDSWSQAGLAGQPNAVQQGREAAPGEDWTQVMGSRTSVPLDLSASSFPSLNNSGLQSQTQNTGSSAWQTGPPPSEQTQRQLQSSRSHLSSRQQAHQANALRDGAYPADAYSRNAPVEFSPESVSQPGRRTSQAHGGPPGPPGGPPGLIQRQGNPASDHVSGDPSRVTSPSAQMQISRSPLSQSIHAAIGDRFLNQDNRSQTKEFSQESPSQSGVVHARDILGDRDSSARGEPSLESILATMSERDKFGMKGYIVEQENAGPAAKSLSRGLDLSTLGINMSSQEPLLASYPGPWAEANAQPLRPLDSEYSNPDCYTVKKIAPLASRINGFMDETLFFIFYTMPRDYTQMLVAQELVARKWRYHMREKQWLTRDEASPSPVLLDDKVSEQGYYIWWDTKLWKKVRRIYTLRYEDLEEQPSMGNRSVHPGAMGAMAGGVNSGMNVGNFNAVPSLERMAAGGRGF